MDGMALLRYLPYIVSSMFVPAVMVLVSISIALNVA